MTTNWIIAGMPSFDLTTITGLRLNTISFFLMLIVVATLLVWKCWKSLRADFTRLPELTLSQSFAFVTLWGFVFLLALTMISGARELMTPGAWKRDGLTHKLESATPPFDADLEARKRRLSILYSVLADHASEHDRQFPSELSQAIQDDALLHPPKWDNANYQYQGDGLSLDQPSKTLLREPNVYSEVRYEITVSGTLLETNP